MTRKEAELKALELAGLTELDLEPKIDPISEEKQKELLKDAYFKICELIEYYMDLHPKYINILALWIIGTYFHEQFNSFPYLYINAMRGSGKSRLLRLITTLSKDGKMLNSMTEAVLFRTKGTLAIDEFENATSKEIQALRELLNSGYKKGTKVIRMRKVKKLDGEGQEAEEFDVYRPILIANITGIDQVLQDRCITLILEKSNNPDKVMLVENFENEEITKNILNFLNQCRLCMYVGIKNVDKAWNCYIKDKNKPTLHTLHTIPTLPTLPTTTAFFDKIIETGIYGRNFELTFPLLLIASWIDENVVDITLSTLSEIVQEKRHEEEIESRDVMLIDYVSKLPSSLEFKKLNIFCINFRDYAELKEDEESNESISRALKRLGLIVDKKRISQGIEVILNVSKAQEKIKMFK